MGIGGVAPKVMGIGPVPATGVQMLAALARELHRRDARYALLTMYIGGGQGLAAVFERTEP